MDAPYLTWSGRSTKTIGMGDLLERYDSKLAGVLHCYDRLVLQGSLAALRYADGMSNYLRRRGIRIFDYTKFAAPLREEIRENAEKLASEAGLEIQFIRKLRGTRKEKVVREYMDGRGDSPGLVCILSAMEACQSYRPWHDKGSGKTFLKPTRGKCLHYYFYFIDSDLGLCYLRVPTWCPFRLQFYFNGHNWLAAKLRAAGLAYEMRDNAFTYLEDVEGAQALADEFSAEELHRKLDAYARMMCPVSDRFDMRYQWSIMQVEYSTDLMFRRQTELKPLYEHLVRTAVHAVKAEDVATFLGRRLTGNYRDELGNDFRRRILGTRIRHSMGPVSIKMYDKCGLVLRIETTANDVSFFKHHRWVHHKNGERTFKLAPVRKTIYSLAPDLQELFHGCNRRYLEFLSELEDPTPQLQAIDRIATSRKLDGRTYRGFNFFQPEDRLLFEILLRGEFNISGFRNRDIRRHLPELSTSGASHRIKRLRVHGMVKKVGRTYKYYLTALGRRVVTAALRLRETVLLPLLADPGPA